MNVWITGESGFIARSFTKYLSHKYNIENSYLNTFYDYWRQLKFKEYHKKEINIFDPTLKTMIERSDIDCIIHTATIVEENNKSHNMIRQNIEGSYYVAKIAQDLKIPILFVCYDQHPNNKFMWTQRTIIDMFDSMDISFTQIITGELFGPDDFYGNISQLLMSSSGKLEQAKIKANLTIPTHYTFIEDFINGLDNVINNIVFYKNKSILIKSPYIKSLGEIIDYMSETMGITLQYDITEEESFNHSNLDSIQLKDWKCKTLFEEALDFTKGVIDER